MLKNIQTKIVMIFAILGIIIISALGLFSLYKIKTIETVSNLSQEAIASIEEQTKQVEIAVYSALGIFVISSLIYSVIVNRIILAPLSKIMKSAEMVSRKKKYLVDGKNKTEFDDLANAFGVMNNELTDNLNEATRQKKQIETILLHMTDGIIAFNIDGKIIHINHAAKTFLNISDENLSFKDIFDKYDIDINMEMVMYLENWTSFERRINCNDRVINLFFASFKDENDIAAGVIAVIQDITEHVKLDEMRKEFVADVSHELKTPITSIMGYSDTLLESNVPENMQKEFLSRISTEANRMAELVSDLLTLSKYDSTSNSAAKEEFDLGELTKNTFDRLKLEIEKKHQDAECLVTADVPSIYADKKGIERVVLNIISNAVKYTRRKWNYKGICWMCL